MKLNDYQHGNRVQWIRDLISGNFQQGTRALKRRKNGEISYCCLGVACERVFPESTNLLFDSSTITMSAALMRERDAESAFGLSYEDQKTASKWNDHYHFSFERIADLVAHATENKLSFDRVPVNGSVPEGYAAEWLHQYN